jgi:phage pi2 protein 07
MLYNYLSNQGDIEATQFYINQLLRERIRIANMPNRWKASGIGKASARLLQRRINSARRKIGLQIKRHLILKNRELDKLIEQHDFARYEMLNAKKEQIKKTIGTEKQVNVDDTMNREFYIQNGFEYYPFKGEYWLDELGNYHYLGTKSCE